MNNNKTMEKEDLTAPKYEPDQKAASKLEDVVPEIHSDAPSGFSSKLHIETGADAGHEAEASGSCWRKAFCCIGVVVVLAAAALGVLVMMKGSDADGPTVYNAVFTITLQGITASQFDADAQSSFKTVVASNAGSVCGADGATLCAASDVTILSSSRRTATTSFKVAGIGDWVSYLFVYDICT